MSKFKSKLPSMFTDAQWTKMVWEEFATSYTPSTLEASKENPFHAIQTNLKDMYLRQGANLSSVTEIDWEHGATPLISPSDAETVRRYAHSGETIEDIGAFMNLPVAVCKRAVMGVYWTCKGGPLQRIPKMGLSSAMALSGPSGSRSSRVHGVMLRVLFRAKEALLPHQYQLLVEQNGLLVEEADQLVEQGACDATITKGDEYEQRRLFRSLEDEERAEVPWPSRRGGG